jgi:osmoprotectant transport system substrate-binding protein
MYRLRSRTILSIAGLAVAALLAACGEEGQSGTEAPDPAAEGEGCAPVAGEQLVVLEDDQMWQTAENIVPAVHEDAATPELLAALNAVSAALDTSTLIELNKAVDIDRETPEQVAADFADAEGLTDGIDDGGSGGVDIVTAGFSESRTLGYLYQIALRAAGFDPEVRTVDSRELYAPELQSGAAQVVPEYAGTLTEFLNGQLNGADPEPLASSDIGDTMTELTALGEQVGLVFGEPSEAANTNAFAVTEDFAQEYGVSTLTELAENCSGSETILGGPPECPERPFCQVGLEDVYGLSAGDFASLDAGGPLTKEALRSGEISVGLVFTTDGDLAQG